MIDRFKDTPSPQFIAARSALLDVVQSESLDSANRVYASAVQEAKRATLSARLKGAKPTGAHPCIARLIRGRCAASNRDQMTAPPCFPPGTDHPRLWIKDGRAVAFTSEPYGVNDRTLREMLTFADRCGLRFDIDANLSPHFPGSTLLVTWTRKGTGA